MHAWIANYVNLISCTAMWKIISIAKAKIEINSSIKGNKKNNNCTLSSKNRNITYYNNGHI